MQDQELTCAECGEPVDPDLSYIMSVPVGGEPLYHHPACIGLDPYERTAPLRRPDGGTG